MLNEDSLAATLDAVNDALFSGRVIPQRQRTVVARWIGARGGQPGSYESMPAPTERDFAAGPALFTGERLTGRGGLACKLGNEGCRALIKLDVRARAVSEALERAQRRMTARLEDADSPRAGYYCCGSCTVAVWRHMLAGGLDHQELRLANGLKHLHRARLGNGRWRFFPCWYTLWTLLEIPSPEARTELQYAAPVLERALRRQPRPDDTYGLRRRQIAQQALAHVYR